MRARGRGRSRNAVFFAVDSAVLVARAQTCFVSERIAGAETILLAGVRAIDRRRLGGLLLAVLCGHPIVRRRLALVLCASHHFDRDDEERSNEEEPAIRMSRLRTLAFVGR